MKVNAAAPVSFGIKTPMKLFVVIDFLVVSVA